MSEFKFGAQAKDKITGFKGTIVTISEWQNGTRSIGMLAKVGKNNEPAKGHEFEADNIEVISEKDAQEIPPWQSAPFGSKVKHKLSPYQGTVIGRAIFMKGCERSYVYSDQLHEGKPVGGLWLDVNELEVITKGPEVPAVEPGKRGGPMPAAERF